MSSWIKKTGRYFPVSSVKCLIKGYTEIHRVKIELHGENLEKTLEGNSKT